MKQAIRQEEKFAQSPHVIYQAGFVELILMVAGECRVCPLKPLWYIRALNIISDEKKSAERRVSSSSFVY